MQGLPNEAQNCPCLKNFCCARMSGKLYVIGFVPTGEKLGISQQEKRTMVFCNIRIHKGA